MTSREILEAAREVLRRDGWQPRWNWNEVGPCCILNAVVRTGVPSRTAALARAIAALSDEAYARTGDPLEFRWNDKHCRDLDDACAFFDAAIKRCAG